MQQLNPSEISALIKQRITDLDTSATAKTEGTIVMVSDGIVRIHGLADAMYGEMIEFDGGLYGMALNLEQDSVGAVVLGDYLSLQEGQKVRCTGRILEVPVGPELLGRVVDALGVRPDKIVIETPVEASSQPDLLAFVLRNYRSNGFRVAVNVDSVLQWQDIASLVHPHFVKIDSRKLGSGEEARARLAWLHSLREDASVIVTRIEGAAQDYQVGATLRQGHALGRPAASPVGQPQTLRVQPA